MGFDVLWTGDWHLTSKGTIAGRYVMRGGVSEVLRDKTNAIAGICEYAETHPLGLIVVPGDVSDVADPDSAAIKVGVDAIQKLSEQAPVVIVKGNHDGGKGSEISNALASFSWREKQGIFVSERPEKFNIIIQGKRVQVFTLPYPRKSRLLLDPKYRNITPEELNRYVSEKMEEILAGFRAEIDRDCLNILVGHFSVGGGWYSPGQMIPLWDVSIKTEHLEVFDLVCLGHLHEPQKYYSGTITRTGFDEGEMNVGFKVVHVSETGQGVRPWTSQEEFIALPSRRFITFNVIDFMKNGTDGLNLTDAIRIKDRVSRPVYESFVLKLKQVYGEYPFIKNAVEVETDVTRVADENLTEEISTEDAIKLWAQGRQGLDMFMGKLIEKSREIESKWREGKTYEN